VSRAGNESFLSESKEAEICLLMYIKDELTNGFVLRYFELRGGYLLWRLPNTGASKSGASAVGERLVSLSLVRHLDLRTCIVNEMRTEEVTASHDIN
jgi:hypothetical protein